DNHAIGISAGMALRGDQPRLLRMTAVLLLDRDREPQPAAASGVGPHPFHFRDAGRFELLPDGSRAVGTAIKGIVVLRLARNGTGQDGIIAVHEGLDPDHGLLLLATGVIAGPFPERTLIHDIVGMNEAFEHDLGMGRDWEVGPWALDH